MQPMPYIYTGGEIITTDTAPPTALSAAIDSECLHDPAAALLAEDLSNVEMGFPRARAMRGKIFYHYGPTNSGKTYTALQSFLQAPSGIYCSPLRLLALEVYEYANSPKNGSVPCGLLTGQETKEVAQSRHVSCTVEMASLHYNLESLNTTTTSCSNIKDHRDDNPVWKVGVIDEIQMIGDPGRGWAWTRALLGLQAEEIHLCGDPGAVELVRGICAATNDDLFELPYDRFLPLSIDEDGTYSSKLHRAQPGDCIIAFSRKDILRIKTTIDEDPNCRFVSSDGRSVRKLRCCVVYGALPPETRVEQAKLFNDPESGYDILVASDAVGMGLNLNIRRVVFYTMQKFDGESVKPLTPLLVKQIAGRAGRRGSVYHQGFVTTFSSEDLPYLKKCLQVDAQIHGQEADRQVDLPSWASVEAQEGSGAVGEQLHGQEADHQVELDVEEGGGVGLELDVEGGGVARSAISTTFTSVAAAGLFPTAHQLQRFAEQNHRKIHDDVEHPLQTDNTVSSAAPQLVPGYNITFSQLLDSFSHACRLDQSLYFLCRNKSLQTAAFLIDSVGSLTLKERYIFGLSPVNLRIPSVQAALVRHATNYSKRLSLQLVLRSDNNNEYDSDDDWCYMRNTSMDYQLQIMEDNYQLLTLYLWLAQHLPEDFCPEKQYAGVALDISRRLSTVLAQERQRLDRVIKLREEDDRARRALNVKIVGIKEMRGEDVYDVVDKFFRYTMALHDPGVETCTRIGHSSEVDRPIIVTFQDAEARQRVMRNRSVLHGEGVWIHEDLTKLQQSERKLLLNYHRALAESKGKKHQLKNPKGGRHQAGKVHAQGWRSQD